MSDGDQRARRATWEFTEHVGYVRADCRLCTGAVGLTRFVVRRQHRERDLRRLDHHTRDVHQRCCGELHAMPHVGCVLR